MHTGVLISGALTLKFHGDYETVKDWAYGQMENDKRKMGDTVYIEVMGCCHEQWFLEPQGWVKALH